MFTIPTLIPLPNLPSIPQNLLVEINNLKIDPYINHPPKITLKNQKEIKSGSHQRFAFDEPLTRWIKHNILDQYRSDSSGISVNTGPSQAPHVDKRRFFNLMYLVDPGGLDVNTVFYKPVTHNLNFDTDSRFCKNYDELEIISKHKLIPHTWNFLYSNTIHSVENITGSRITVQLGLMFDISNQLLSR
jgi:hypothetical protein